MSWHVRVNNLFTISTNFSLETNGTCNWMWKKLNIAVIHTARGFKKCYFPRRSHVLDIDHTNWYKMYDIINVLFWSIRFCFKYTLDEIFQSSFMIRLTKTDLTNNNSKRLLKNNFSVMFFMRLVDSTSLARVLGIIFHYN